METLEKEKFLGKLITLFGVLIISLIIYSFFFYLPGFYQLLGEEIPERLLNASGSIPLWRSLIFYIILSLVMIETLVAAVFFLKWL